MLTGSPSRPTLPRGFSSATQWTDLVGTIFDQSLCVSSLLYNETIKAAGRDKFQVGVFSTAIVLASSKSRFDEFGDFIALHEDKHGIDIAGDKHTLVIIFI